MKFTTSDGLQLAYEDEGTGLVLLCLPGLTRNARDFDNLAAVFTDVRIVRLTYRGRGESDYDPDFMNYNVPREMRDVIELLDHLGIDKAVFVGTSRGGIISMLTAAMMKDRMLGVVLNDIGPVLDAGGLERIFDFLGVPPKGQNLAEIVAGLKATMGAGFPTLSDAEWEVQASRWFDFTDGRPRLNYDAKLRDAMMAQAEQESPDLWPLFDAMAGLPLVLIRGANTDLLGVDTVAEMQRRRPDMIYANAPDRAHVPLLDEPEAVVAINKLLKEVAG